MVGASAWTAEDQLARLRRSGVPPKLVMTAYKTEECLVRQPGQKLVSGKKPVRFWHSVRLFRTRPQHKAPSLRTRQVVVAIDLRRRQQCSGCCRWQSRPQLTVSRALLTLPQRLPNEVVRTSAGQWRQLAFPTLSRRTQP